MGRIHHSAICVTDVGESLRFWRDGLGFAVLMDRSFEGDWPKLFGAPGRLLRSVFLGDPSDDDSGIVELVEFDGALPGPQDRGGPNSGFFLLSVTTDVEAVLTRLRQLGLGGEPRRIKAYGVDMAVVSDPNGVRVELVDG